MQDKYIEIGFNYKHVAAGVGFLFLTLTLSSYITFRSVSAFYDKNRVEFLPIIEVKINPPFKIVPRVSQVQATESAQIVFQEVQKVEVVTSSMETRLEPTIEQIIAEEWGADAEIGKKIAFCESSYNPEAKNKNSSATGLFQIIKSTWEANRKRMNADTNLDLRLDARENAKTAYFLYKQQGGNPWKSSQHCWSK